MAFIPEDARWYLADVVLELTVEGDSRNVVQVNILLIEAESPEQAYEKANLLGRESEQVYTNTAGRKVHVKFRGLRDLNVIHEELEDGAELTYHESIGVSEDELSTWLRTRERLGVFSDVEHNRDVPNFMPDSVMKLIEEEGFSREDIEDQS